jgi:GxxExxY protein
MNHGERGEEAIELAEGDLTGRIIGMAIKIHKTLGPGLFEEFYEDCLGLELSRAGLRFERQVILPAMYEGVRFEQTYTSPFNP